MSWFSAARTRLQLLFSGRAAETRMDEELAFHVEMESARLVREENLSIEEARRRALVAFGGVAYHKEELRAGRGLAWLGGLSLDFKLGARMLVKFPGLTVVGGLAMAFGIWVGVVIFGMLDTGIHPKMPLPDGDRIVQIRNFDVAANKPELRAAYDFGIWRDALSSISDIGAYRDAERNLIGSDGGGDAVRVAEMSASGFRVAGTRAMLGRVLLPDDERPDAPPVVVIGYNVWTTRFAGSPKVIGRTVRLGDEYPTVVGVMPEGFEFPVSHDLWTPLHLNGVSAAPREGLDVRVFGLLKPGVSLATAQSELTTVGRRMSRENPLTHEHLDPRVAPFASMFLELNASDLNIVFLINGLAIMLLVLVSSNVALLLFARAATRESELVVRSALGASRRRIIMQLTAEALVLGAVAAIVGLAGAQYALRHWGGPFLEKNLGRLPFWYDFGLSPRMVFYALGLTVFGALIAGVLPALKITRGLGARLKAATAGGGGVQFGGVWTAVIVTQVAFTVAFPAVAYVEQGELRRIRGYDAGFAANEYLAARLQMDMPPVAPDDEKAARASYEARYRNALQSMRDRISSEPGVTGVTFVDALPRNEHDQKRVEVEDVNTSTSGGASATPRERLPIVSRAAIDPSYFEVLHAPILAGRGFSAADASPDSRTVIVDQGFVEGVLGGRNPIGRRIRFPSRRDGDQVVNDPWYEIVGEVKDLGMASATSRRRGAGVYRAADLGNWGPMNIVVNTQGDPIAFAGRVRAIAAAVDPTLRVSDIQRVNETTSELLWILRLWMRCTLGLITIAVLLSLAGIYSVLSFTVSRRTREIGVRVALGASRRGLITAIFRRPLIQVTAGVIVGGALIAGAATLLHITGINDGSEAVDALSPGQIAGLVAYAGLMFGVCLLACIVPTRRALGVEPMEALRAE